MAKLSPSERVQALEARLGMRLEKPELGLTALTHKSYLNEHLEERLQDNERLEFLGDAVVNLAVGHRLMERMPQAPEGELTRLRALVVNAETLASISRRLGLGELLLLGRGEAMSGGRDKNSVLADALEAVIGAVYLGSGLGPVLELVDRHFSESMARAAQVTRDYKTALQQQTQEQLKLTPRYRLVSESGPEHEKTFEVEVSIGSEPYARATGRNKKEAEQAAARATLGMLQQGLRPAAEPAPAAAPQAPGPAPGPSKDDMRPQNPLATPRAEE